MHIRFLASKLTLGAALLSLAACQTTAPDRFKQADVNKDGVLTPDEINNALVTKLFNSVDKNHDGKVTIQEWDASGDKGQMKLFVVRDANKDGVVTLTEALAYGKKHGMAATVMIKADKNKDGVITREEAVAYYGATE